MGLDMYLTGRKYFSSFDETQRKEDNFRVKALEVELGYWRKHPNLHGFIVKTFAEGVDECQPIDLSEESLDQIIDAIKKKNLPHTEGFFFGDSNWHGGKEEEYAQVFEKAKAWLNEEDKGYRSVFYQASW